MSGSLECHRTVVAVQKPDALPPAAREFKSRSFLGLESMKCVFLLLGQEDSAIFVSLASHRLTRG